MSKTSTWNYRWPTLAAAVVLLAAQAPAYADELSCPPLIEHSLVTDAEITHGQGLLWRIEDQQHRDHAASYVFGTIHLGDPRVAAVPPDVKSALLASQSFFMEAKFDPTSMSEFAQQMTLPSDKKLEAIVGSALFRRAEQLLSHFNVPAETAQHLRPWAVFMTLNQPQSDHGLPLDLVLMQMASDAGKSVTGIETLREQADVFAGFSDSDQIKMLRDSVCYYDRVQADLQRLLEMYVARDLTGIVRLADTYEGSDEELAERMLKVLITDRNLRMAKRLQPFLQHGGAFIAVGALHLPGDDGLLHLLEQRGFGVTRVY
ncbi:MAG: TraB/GumN family protein [Gammaproteobacteria bacterium]